MDTKATNSIPASTTLAVERTRLLMSVRCLPGSERQLSDKFRLHDLQILPVHAATGPEVRREPLIQRTRLIDGKRQQIMSPAGAELRSESTLQWSSCPSSRVSGPDKCLRSAR